ncbi:SusC/RagA family TonB-linked outer membrane protein [Flavobacterium sp. NKUCC04_CG]|uniref:SusC/RagA family TonB-linked outer membrane protein n=1 Tax=Flavobacterium sp. NKUCC04_CG TaxID=2842121 RepID=UPI001C5AF5D5|nr:SusC/RagA family TonB-linked outer membrane protein [Flavobacterium sp. NKUCC04_CG]MBW3519815.1 SusC/RagA family TonB-linked outer membrane protein [Flavobacterium sp. NKUCC04_CG]
MKTIIQILCFFILGIASLNAQEQAREFHGTVYNAASKTPLADVIITHGESGAVYLTNEAGFYRLIAREGDRLLFSHQGFENMEIVLKKQGLVMYMIPSTDFMDEIVIRKNNNINDIDMRKLTGTITTLDLTALSQRTEMDMGRLLQGQIPGLTVRFSGELGTKPEIRIRGNQSFSYKQDANEPMFILDGMVISSENFLTLNPADYKEIKVLKDAAASALYGIKAANGVIEITSKRGFEGKPIVNFSLKQGVTLRGERGTQLMQSAEKLELERRIKNPITPGYRYSEEFIRKENPQAHNLDDLVLKGRNTLDSLRLINTDWFKEIIQPNLFNSYNLSIRGGSEKSSYFYGLNYANQGGRVPGNDINRLSARANLDYILSPTLTISLNNAVGLSTIYSQNDPSFDPTALVFNLNPYEQKNTLGNHKGTTLYSYPDRTYEDLINQFFSKRTTKRLSSSAILRWQLAKELELSAVVGADYTLDQRTNRIPPRAFSQRQYKSYESGELQQDKGVNYEFTSNIRANYQKQWNDHDIYLGVNVDYYVNNKELIGIKGYGIPEGVHTAAGINQSLTGERKVKSYSYTLKEAQMGIGAAMGYSFQNTYDIYSSVKQDASSLLPANKRWNTAWSGGLGWAISEYGFLNASSIIDILKIRYSLGYIASMAEINSSDIHQTFAYNQAVYGDGRLLDLVKLPNPNLKPQQTISSNLGFEMGLFHRISLQMSFYTNTTKQALLDLPIAPSNGFSMLKTNIGELENKGIEFQLTGDFIRYKNFRWNAALSFSTNKNKVLKLYNTNQIFLTDESLMPEYEVGQPLGVLYGLHDLGIYSLDGMPRFLGADGREITYKDKLKRADIRSLGYTIPPYNGFFNHVFSWRDFSLSMDVSYSFGGVLSYSNVYVRDADNSNKNAVKGQLEEMWFAPGDENKRYAAPNIDSSFYVFSQYASTKTTFKSDFIKLNMLQLSYGFSPKSQSGLANYFKTINCNIQAENLYTYRIESDKGDLHGVLQPVISLGINASF